MGTFRQLGDPVCPDCLCQHHEEAYAEEVPPVAPLGITANNIGIGAGATVVQVQITITETCCVVVNAAIAAYYLAAVTDFEIERPLGSVRTLQEDFIGADDIELMHHAAWEVLTAGTYTYYLVNRSGSTRGIFGAWIKAVASDCLG